MASESVVETTTLTNGGVAGAAAAESENPEMYGAPALKGNFTDAAEAHLWCANALASVVASPEAMEDWNDDIQQALRYLLQRETRRAMKAQEAERRARHGN